LFLPAVGAKQPEFTITELVNLEGTRYGSYLLDVDDAMACNYKTIFSLSITTSILSAAPIESLAKLIMKTIPFRVLRNRKLLMSLVF
jgi:hypothetical protein